MIRISVTEAAFAAVAETLPFGNVGFETQRNERGEHMIWLEARVVDRLVALRRERESYSDVILRLVEIEARARGGRAL
jgi:hypothetical protein